MTARNLNALTCEYPECKELVIAKGSESTDTLRARAGRDHGWTSRRDTRGWIDLCRGHS